MLATVVGMHDAWNLPARIEDQCEEQWQAWLDQGERWSPFLAHLAGAGRNDRLVALAEAGLAETAAALPYNPR